MSSTVSETVFFSYSPLTSKSFKPSVWGSQLYCGQNSTRTNIPQHLGQRTDDEVLNRKSCVLYYMYTLSTGRPKIGDQIIPVSKKVRDLSLVFSCSFNFSERALYQVAKCNKIFGLLPKSFKLNKDKLSLFKTHVTFILDYCPLICCGSKLCDELAVENVRRAFAKQPVDISSNLI